MNLCVIGTGYVGLVTGTCFAEMGNTVICVDKDAGKIAALERGVIPIFEPGLEPLVMRNVREGRLRFALSPATAVQQATIFFIAVGTPPHEDGSADLSHVLAAARELAGHLTGYALVVTKSTVPVGTADRVRQVINEELQRRGLAVEFDVVSNPEFLKEGDAVNDFMRPDRVIIGSDSGRATAMLRELYAPFMRNHERILVMGVRDAELTKYAANAMLATKISFINEIANLCERLGVDVENVRLGIGSDARIGYSFIYPGCGYGGSCFPKDVQSLIHSAEMAGGEVDLLRAVEKRNAAQKQRLFGKIAARFGDDLNGRTFALWGLAFKPGTDDLREAPALVLLQQLLAAGARVAAHDPVAMPAARNMVPAQWLENGQLTFADNPYDALREADALVLVTEWKPFRHPDFAAIQRLLKQPVVFDGRNQYDPRNMELQGFEYYGMGRGRAAPPAA